MGSDLGIRDGSFEGFQPVILKQVDFTFDGDTLEGFVGKELFHV